MQLNTGGRNKAGLFFVVVTIWHERSEKARQRKSGLGIYESKYIFDRHSSSGAKTVKTTPKDKTFNVVFCLEWQIVRSGFMFFSSKKCFQYVGKLLSQLLWLIKNFFFLLMSSYSTVA
jgi:hypothetical protein